MDNELRALLIVCGSAIKKQLEQKPLGGVRTEYGKISYETALEGISKLQDYFGIKGCFSIGICLTCDNFTTKGNTSIYDCFGRCSLKPNTVHVYESCNQHHEIRRN